MYVDRCHSSISLTTIIFFRRYIDMKRVWQESSDNINSTMIIIIIWALFRMLGLWPKNLSNILMNIIYDCMSLVCVCMHCVNICCVFLCACSFLAGTSLIWNQIMGMSAFVWLNDWESQTSMKMQNGSSWQLMRDVESHICVMNAMMHRKSTMQGNWTE